MAQQTLALLVVLPLVMVALGIQLGMLSMPGVTNDCAACGRKVRRGRTCPCVDRHR